MGEINFVALRKTIENRVEADEIVEKVKVSCIPTNTDLTTCDDGARLYRCIDNIAKRLKKSTTEAADWISICSRKMKLY